MFSNEIKVNGVLIGHVYCYRKSFITEDRYEYLYRYYRIGDGKRIEGRVFHNYDDGIEKLQALIFNDVCVKLEEINYAK